MVVHHIIQKYSWQICQVSWIELGFRVLGLAQTFQSLCHMNMWA